MNLTTLVALGAAVATMFSALFIGWQAWETRRSAGSSNKSAEASKAALVVANESLDLNRRQAEVAAFMVAEATRARLETNAPAVSMRFVDGDNPRQLEVIATKATSSGAIQTKRIGDVFQLPQDSEWWIYILFDVVFHNDGLVPVTVQSNSTVIINLEGHLWERSFRLEVGESAAKCLAVGTSLEGWTESRDDKTKPRGHAGWVTELNSDSGVRLTQAIHIDGTVLEPGQKEGDFTIRQLGPDVNYPSFLVKDQPKRTYWLGGQVIPSLVPDDAFGAAGKGIAQ